MRPEPGSVDARCAATRHLQLKVTRLQPLYKDATRRLVAKPAMTVVSLPAKARLIAGKRHDGHASAASDGPIALGAARIVQAALDPEASIQQLGDMARQDPALAVRVLSLANSPAFGVKGAVTDVRQATALIGLRGLRNVALSLVVADMIPNRPESNVLLVQSLRRAEAARLIAERLGLKAPDSFFSTGLLLEVGILARAKENLDSSIRTAHHSSEHRLLFEQAEGFAPHCARGAELARGFGLPEATVNAIVHHHDPTAPKDMLGRVCWVAEKVAGAFESGSVARAKKRAIDAGFGLGLCEEAVLEVLSLLPRCVETAAAAFQRQVGAQPDLEQLRDNVNSQLLELNMQYDQTIRALERVLKEKEELAEQLRLVNAELAEQASTDALTSLPNRRTLLTSLRRDLARADRDKQPLGFVLLDVDHFKRVNDDHGHPIGDEVLRTVGKILLTGARKGDLPARYGGEEFCLLLPGADLQGAVLAATRFRVAISRAKVDAPNGPLSVTASFGAAVALPGLSTSAEELIKAADDALYRAKATGRNRVVAAE